MKQNTLWPEDVTKAKKARLEFYKPLPDKLSKCEDMLQLERVSDLQPKFQDIKGAVSCYQLVLVTAKGESPLPEYLLNIINKKGALNKSELVRFISFFLSDVRNFHAYLQSLDKEVQTVWTIIIENYFASNKMLQKATGQTWMYLERPSYSFYSDSIHLSNKLPWFFILPSRISYSLRDYYLCIPRQYRKYLYPIFLTHKINSFISLTDLPEKEELQVFNEEKQLFRLLPIAESLYKQDLLAIAKGKISAAALKKINKLFCAREFFPEDTNGTVSQLRTFMLLSAYSIYHSMIKKELEPEMFIKSLIKQLINYPAILLTLTLPHVSGVKSKMLAECYATKQAFNILQLLSSCNPGMWTDIECIRLRLYGLEQECCYNVLFSGSVVQNAEFFNTKHNKEHILLEDIYNEMGVPFIKGFFFLLASFGIVEIAYGQHDPDAPSYCCSLRYIRLTPLGEYVLDIKKDYEPEISEEIYFEVNNDDLIMLSTNKDNPYEALLTDISTPIGGHRYKITPDSFLKNCNKQADIENKISFFKKHVCKLPPQNWEDFFRTILQKCDPLQKVNSEKYSIYQLKEMDKELQHLVSTDPYLRQYTKRAEDYMLLIEKKHLNDVTKRLKSFGYLL